MNDVQREMDQIERRTRRYWFDDGLAEIAAGAGFLLVAGSLLFALVFEGRLGRLANLAFPIVVVVVAFASKRAIRAAKNRYVYPRTGYASFESRLRNRVANAVLGGIIAAVFAFIAARSGAAFHEWIPAFTGLLLAVGFFFVGRKVDVLRFPLAGISCAIVGVLLSALRISGDLAGCLLFAWVGLVMVVGGAAAFASYLRNAPPLTHGGDGNGAGEGA